LVSKLRGMESNSKWLLLPGASALVLAIWLSRNEAVFDKSPNKIFYACTFQDNILPPIMESIGEAWGGQADNKNCKLETRDCDNAYFVGHEQRFSNRVCM
jgi:hypothetical protein